MKIKIFLVIPALLLILTTTSCSSRYVSTNLDAKSFNQYFSISKVKIYTNENEIHGGYQFIGTVEGQDCQVKPHHAIPDEINARTQARQQAASIQANGIVFSKCALLSQAQLTQLNNTNDAKQCHAIVVCYGKAYAVETESNTHN